MLAIPPEILANNMSPPLTLSMSNCSGSDEDGDGTFDLFPDLFCFGTLSDSTSLTLRHMNHDEDNSYVPGDYMSNAKRLVYPGTGAEKLVYSVSDEVEVEDVEEAAQPHTNAVCVDVDYNFDFYERRGKDNRSHLIELTANARNASDANGDPIVNDNDNDNADTPCMSKSAIAARENRVRKKKHMNILQNTVHTLTTENSCLRQHATQLEGTVDSLKREVTYLRQVIANESTLGPLLKNVCSTPGVEFVGSQLLGVDLSDEDDLSDEADFPARCTSRNAAGDARMTNKHQRVDLKHTCHDHDYATTGGATTRDNDAGAAGICLHVTGRSVSLELCEVCNSKARSSVRKKRRHPPSKRNGGKKTRAT